METRQQKDLELWREWQKDKNPQTLGLLLDRLQPLIYRETSKWQGAVPGAALESKGRLLAAEALETYNPNMGAAIGTHVTSRLRKLSRSVYPYQNIARLPENKQLMYNTYSGAQNRLMDSLGREPTTEELADELKWTPRKVRDFTTAFDRKEYVESTGLNMEVDSDSSHLTDFLYMSLAPDDKAFFEDVTGYGGRRPLNNTQLMAKYNLTQGMLSYKKRKFVDQIQGMQR